MTPQDHILAGLINTQRWHADLLPFRDYIPQLEWDVVAITTIALYMKHLVLAMDGGGW